MVAGTEPINLALREHIESMSDAGQASLWPAAKGVAWLHEWATRFTLFFNLDVPVPAIGIERLRFNRLGQYLRGRNALGVRHEILFNSQHIGRDQFELLTTLFHELLHEWQTIHGARPPKTKNHNREFRDKCAVYGLAVTPKGVTTVLPGAFEELLKTHGVTRTPAGPVAPVAKPPARGKMQKWACGCRFAIRAAVEIDITCNTCGERFARATARW